MVSGRLEEKSNHFYIVLSYTDSNGKRKQPWFATGLCVRGNRRVAERMLLEYRKNFDITTGRLIEEKEEPAPVVEAKIPLTSEVLFGDYLIDWLEEIKYTIEQSTYAGYKMNIVHVIAPYFNQKGIRLCDLSGKVIDEFYKEKLASLSANTIIHYHANIRKALQDAFRNDLIPCNFADKAHRPKKQNFYCGFYNKDQLLRLFDYVKGSNIEFAVLFAGYYGLRRSEIIGLKWENIDFDLNTIAIKHTVTECTIDGKYMILAKDRAKTKKSIRTLPLLEPIRELLLRMREIENANKAFFGKEYNNKDEGYIYRDNKGNLVKPNYLSVKFRNTVERIGDLPKIRFHDLRHSCASLLRNEGIPMEDIQKWLGHSQITTTESIYAHFDSKKHINSANTILKAFNS